MSNSKEEIIRYDNYKWLSDHLSTNDEVMEVSKYLKDNEAYIITKTWNADKSPETGYSFRVFLDGIDLSGNGVCFHGTRLLQHVRGFKNFEELKNKDGYSEYLDLRAKYEKVYRYFNR